MARAITTTAVGIVGGGPAGLMLSHLLHVAGIESVVVDNRLRSEIEHTHRAGILEHDSVRLLVESGVSDRVLREGREHEGVILRFGGASHRIDFQALAGASTWLYPQTDVFIDLADARARDGGDVRFGVSDTDVVDVTSHRPGILFTDASGAEQEIRCEILVGADGSNSMTRRHIAGQRQYYREYPYAWFGILCEAPPSARELIYTRSERGFALISQRTDGIQRMYFECSPTESVDDWPEDRIWAELQARLAGPDGFSLSEGPIFEKTVLPFRSFVCEPMRHGNLVLAGDAAHTVPPTGAKGLNLALADVAVLADILEQVLVKRDHSALDQYTDRALSRVWKAQHFSYWMTTMLHRGENITEFDLRRQLGELESVVNSEAGSAYLAHGYTGWPSGQ
ncbi:4-hydroxybenzoate 3-monooxygenase [Phytoactinopolyspora mesophila]|uniref:4-hydroxybenzoate 3-monooxygenase n=1 Tax=Phytoactinopolyspora mesophila TaxID=2650750 RepID=A0A7K3LZK5_9ACTN|nr:4-hydroxybenzoate 3-monooxygenase [Phytoactinopolyspora mesophila]NDL56429.1 4-hydroxybenzoate 3-monooxygenase [Phytoactinopolyspora mesophila]